MEVTVLNHYLEITNQEIQVQLIQLLNRNFPEPGKRQEAFLEIETLLCAGLFHVLDPHHFGGGNIHLAPAPVKALATFFRRSLASITSKMLNLDGSRKNGVLLDTYLFATLSKEPSRFYSLYSKILESARNIGVDEKSLPDYLGLLELLNADDVLLGQEELPNNLVVLLKDATSEMAEIQANYHLGDILTEKLVEQKVRLLQHRFARGVLENCGYGCVFCGFSPKSLPTRNGLLRASHIKPWAAAEPKERIDIRNGLAACPTHDAAFDKGFLYVNGGLKIHKSRDLLESIEKDQTVDLYFGSSLKPTILLPSGIYLSYHRQNIFRS